MSNTLHEVSKRSIIISKYLVSSVTCNDSVLTASSDKGIHLLDYSYNMKSLDKAIDIVESIIHTPKNSPASYLFPKEVICKETPSLQFNQMIIDQSLWPHSHLLMENSVTVVSLEWSPKDLIHNNQNVIAVLNNIGGVELFGQQRFRWLIILNLSCVIEEHFKDQLPKLKDLNDIKTAVNLVETSAICWSPKLNEDHSCYFITCQKNGTILFWSIICQGLDSKADFVGKLDSEIDEAISVKWIWNLDNRFMLIYSNIFGEVAAKICSIENKEITVLKTDLIWKYKDRMVLTNLNYRVVNDKVVLVYSKYRHLVVQLLDWDLNVLSQHIQNVIDSKISFISQDENDFVMSTIDFQIYTFDVKIYDTQLEIGSKRINLKETYSTHEFHGGKFSKNKVLFTAVTFDRKVFSRKQNYIIDVIYMCVDMELDEVARILLNNPTKKLANYWDCLEFLRYKCMKQKKLPMLDYQKMFTESTDVYTLKLYYMFVVFYLSLTNALSSETKGLLPETSLIVVQERIFLHQAKSLIEKYQNCETMTNLVSDYLDGAEKYVDYYCMKYKKDVSSVANVRSKKEKKEYICQCCDAPIVGFSCLNEHLNMFCSLSLTPIQTDDYLTCKGCGLLARIELLDTKPECVLCDLPLNNCYLPI